MSSDKDSTRLSEPDASGESNLLATLRPCRINRFKQRAESRATPAELSGPRLWSSLDGTGRSSGPDNGISRENFRYASRRMCNARCWRKGAKGRQGGAKQTSATVLNSQTSREKWTTKTTLTKHRTRATPKKYQRSLLALRGPDSFSAGAIRKILQICMYIQSVRFTNGA